MILVDTVLQVVSVLIRGGGNCSLFSWRFGGVPACGEEPKRHGLEVDYMLCVLVKGLTKRHHYDTNQL